MFGQIRASPLPENMLEADEITLFYFKESEEHKMPIMNKRKNGEEGRHSALFSASLINDLLGLVPWDLDA